MPRTPLQASNPKKSNPNKAQNTKLETPDQLASPEFGIPNLKLEFI